jgi:hypothetical protein
MVPPSDRIDTKGVVFAVTVVHPVLAGEGASAIA